MPSGSLEISSGVFWVGVEDWDRRVFDAFIPLPYGTSYNSYLIVGSNKSALIDTVNPGFEGSLLREISQILAPEKLDYVIMNHAEPDHAGSIPAVLKIAKHAKLVASKLGVNMAEMYFKVPHERQIRVKENDVIELGGKTLRFIEAPWLHWPETMFTYDMAEKVLFSCDFFGSHMTSGKLYADEVGELLQPEAKRYYAEIMMPFSASVQQALDKVKLLQPEKIAPSHGPVYRDPQAIIELYEKWARGPLEKKVVVIYVSMWGNTEALQRVITETISSKGIEVIPYNLTVSDVSHVLRDLVDASAVVIGSPTVLGGAHPLAMYATELVASFGVRGKIAAVFGSFGWGGGAVRRLTARLEKGGFEIVDALEVRGPPEEEHFRRAVTLSEAIADKVAGET